MIPRPCARWCDLTLQSAGHEVVSAVDGVDGLKKASAGAPVDLVITDVNMPNMDGLTLVRELRRLPQYRGVPLLVLTTEASAEKKQEGQGRRRHRLDRQALRSGPPAGHRATRCWAEHRQVAAAMRLRRRHSMTAEPVKQREFVFTDADFNSLRAAGQGHLGHHARRLQARAGVWPAVAPPAALRHGVLCRLSRAAGGRGRRRRRWASSPMR